MRRPAETSETTANAAALHAENAILRERLASLHQRMNELHEQLSLRDHALDATPTLFMIAKYGSSEPTVVYCNKIVADQHGTSRESLIGTSVNLLTQWRANRTDMTTVDAALSAGEVFRYEGEVTRCDGSTFWLGMTVRPLLDEAGRLSHSVSIGADITARRDEEFRDRQLQAQRLEEMKERERMAIDSQMAQKQESVGRLAAGIAHEIQNPIQDVGDSMRFLRSGYADMSRLTEDWRRTIFDGGDQEPAGGLRARLAEADRHCDLKVLNVEMPEAFDRILDGVQRVSSIVDAMKEFAHPDSREQGPADLNNAIRTTLIVASNEYRYVAAVTAQYGELPLVTCHVGELNQVFLNLIINAAQAIRDAGRMSGGEIKVSTSFAGGFATVAISDNGCGIPPEIASKIYEPFFTTREAGRGSGQGLAIARSLIVDKHGGALSMNTLVGAGTTFTIRLPVGGRELQR